MRRTTIQLVCLAGVAIGVLSSFWAATQTEEHQEHGSEEHSAPHQEELPPHSRAPHNVPLVIHEGAWLRAPGEAWFARQSELEPGRFSRASEDEPWVDARGIFEYRYDEAEDFSAYWQWVGPQQLTRGRQDFVQFCSSCHGLEGDGYGRSGQWLRPSPRSFKQVHFKFTKTTSALPTDAALMRLIKRGLDGTPMLPWALSDEQLTDIIQYFKSLSNEGEGWRNVFTEIGDVVEAELDPWKGKEGYAIKAGERIFHDKAKCMDCHPSYVSSAKLAELKGDPAGTKYRDNLFRPVLKESEFTVLGQPVKILPPDFTFHQVRSGTTRLDLFETIASGVKGTAMPAWKGSMPDEDLWALAYYVESLIQTYKDKPAKREELMNSLREGL